MAKNYYMILGIAAGASMEEIKAAYRRRALELHPDLSGADNEPFLDLQEAYSVLSDPSRRRDYDSRLQSARVASRGGTRIGEPVAPRRREAEPLRAQRPRTHLGTVRLTEDFETYAPSLDDIFERIWSNFGAGERPKSEQIRSLTVDIAISAEQAFRGGVVRLQVPALVQCPTCGGEGVVGLFECLRCAGQGRLVGAGTVAVEFPAGLSSDFVTQIALDDFGIDNLYLTVRFRASEAMV
jgi:DnaJ-class molecular chaperone